MAPETRSIQAPIESAKRLTLRRSIQLLIEDPLADFVLGRDLKEGSTIVADRREIGPDGPVPDASLVEITIVEGPAPEPEKVTVLADEPAADGPADDE